MVEKIDLNAPAFGAGAQKIEETPVVSEETPEVKAKEEIAETPEEESKVPYSRFKKFHDEARLVPKYRQEADQYKREAEEWRAKAEAIKSSENVPTSELPEFWKKLYGDSDASLEAWKIQSEQNDALLSKAREEALNAVHNERMEEVKRTEENVEKIDSNFEKLSAFVGRDLTEKEQSAILDIVDEFTSKDEDGNYLGEILPFEKGWEIYELKTQASKAPRSQSRDNVASLSGSPSQGEPSAIAEKNKNFNPFDWDSYKKRI